MKIYFFVSFLTAILLQTACATAQTQIETAPTDYGFQKVIWVILENTNVADAANNPYLKSLMAKGAYFSNMNGEAHPSQPNYIAMIAGNTHGVLGDGNADLVGAHIGDLLESHGRTWKNYAENFPGNCFKGATSGRYARKHVPFMSFTNVSENPTRCANIVEAAAFDADLAANRLPDYSMYSPNLDNDGHDTNISTSSAFIQKRFGALIEDPEFMKDKLFVLTFDESETYFSNHIYTLIIGGNVLAGSQTSQKLNHVSLMRVIEEQFKLGFIDNNDGNATLPIGIWK